MAILPKCLIKWLHDYFHVEYEIIIIVLVYRPVLPRKGRVTDRAMYGEHLAQGHYVRFFMATARI